MLWSRYNPDASIVNLVMSEDENGSPDSLSNYRSWKCQERQVSGQQGTVGETCLDMVRGGFGEAWPSLSEIWTIASIFKHLTGWVMFFNPRWEINISNISNIRYVSVLSLLQCGSALSASSHVGASSILPVNILHKPWVSLQSEVRKQCWCECLSFSSVLWVEDLFALRS